MKNDQEQSLSAEVINWLNREVAETGKDLTSLARKAGIDPSIISRITTREVKKPSARTLRKLVESLSVPPPASVQKVLDISPGLHKAYEMNIITGKGLNEIPVWGVIPVTMPDEFHLNPMSISSIARSHVGHKGKKLIAFLAPDETMSPRWQTGEPVVVDLARPAANGYCLIKLKAPIDPNGEETYMFRRVLERSDGKLFVMALKNMEVSTVPLDRVLEVRLVLSWTDILE